MEEEQKQDYREHLINTIDMLIDSGISIYDLDVVNKKAIRHNYILKQKVKDLMEKEKLPLIIVGGRGNCKTLAYGIKLGKIKACEELLEEDNK